MLFKNDFTMGNYMTYLLNKEKFDAVANYLTELLKKQESKVKEQLNNDISYIDGEGFQAIKEKLAELDKYISKLESSSELLFDINLSKLVNLLELHYSRLKLDIFLSEIENLIK